MPRLRLMTACFGLIGLIISGCSHTYTFTPDDEDGFYERINTAAQTQNVLIRMEGGEERRGANVQVAADSVTWMTPDPFTRRFTRRRGVPRQQVTEIVVTNRTKSSLIGAGLGMAAGLVLGVVPGTINSIQANQFNTGRTIIFGSMFSAIGGVGGAIAGWQKGSLETFVFSEYLEGTDEYLITQQLKGAGPGMDVLLTNLRRSIRGMDSGRTQERVTQSNIVYTVDDRPFCFLVVDSRSVKIYLSVRQADVSDPLGMLRPWSTGDSWFMISPGGDMDYTMNLIRQAYGKVNT